MPLSITIIDNALETKEVAFSSLNDHPVKTQLIAELVRSELSNLRGGNAHTKTRADVRGGGRKPWKQKGTGRARHGSTRSPIWVGGGVAWGPKNTVNWTCKINKSAKVSALKSIFKDRLDHGGVFKFTENFDLPKTKQAVEVIENITNKTTTKSKKMLVIYTTGEKLQISGFPNTDVKMINVLNLKIHALASAEKYLMTPGAKLILEEKLAA